MDLSNSERESVIETAIDTISGIGRDSRNSAWFPKDSENFGYLNTSWGSKTAQTATVCDEVVEDSKNLHSDASSLYRPDIKLGSILSTRDSALHPQTRVSLQRQDTFENLPSSNYQVSVISGAVGRPESICANHTSRPDENGIAKVNAESPKNVNSSTLICTSAMDPDNADNNKGSLHGLEVSHSKSSHYKTTHPQGNAFRSPAVEKDGARKITFKGLYSCKIIRRERNAGLKLRKELEMRRKDEGSPKVVRLAQKGANEFKSSANLDTNLENTSLLNQMKRWLHVTKSNGDCNTKDATLATKPPMQETRDGHSIKLQPGTFQRRLHDDSSSLFSEVGSDASSYLAASAHSSAPSTPGEAKYSRERNVASCGGISDTVTYNCIKRSNVHRKIQELKKSSRKNRKTTPERQIQADCRMERFVKYDANIADERTYKKGLPNFKMSRKQGATEIATTSKETAFEQLIPATTNIETKLATCSQHCEGATDDDEKGSKREHNSLKKKSAKQTSLAVHFGNEAIRLQTPDNRSLKDASCGPDPYVKTRQHELSCNIAYDISQNFSDGRGTLDKNVGTGDIGVSTKHILTCEENAQDDTNGKLYGQLWQGLKNLATHADDSHTDNRRNEQNNFRVIYADGYGHFREVPYNVWTQIQTALLMEE